MILVIGLWPFLRALCLGPAAIALENLALRHQLLVIQRSVTRPRLSRWDRIFWVWLSCLDAEICHLIRRMAQENPTWGRRRIQAELALLGYEVAELTVAKYMDRTSPRPFANLARVSDHLCPRHRGRRLPPLLTQTSPIAQTEQGLDFAAAVTGLADQVEGSLILGDRLVVLPENCEHGAAADVEVGQDTRRWAGHHPLGRLEGPSVVRLRLRVGEGVAGAPPGQHAVFHRLLPRLALGEVVGQLLKMLGQPVGVQPLLVNDLERLQLPEDAFELTGEARDPFQEAPEELLADHRGELDCPLTLVPQAIEAAP